MMESDTRHLCQEQTGWHRDQLPIMVFDTNISLQTSNDLSPVNGFDSSGGALSCCEVPSCLEADPTKDLVGRPVPDSCWIWSVGSCEDPICKSWQRRHRCGNGSTSQRFILQDCSCTLPGNSAFQASSGAFQASSIAFSTGRGCYLQLYTCASSGAFQLSSDAS